VINFKISILNPSQSISDPSTFKFPSNHDLSYLSSLKTTKLT